jgi:hypothetical protein
MTYGSGAGPQAGAMSGQRISALRDGLPEEAACWFDPELHDGPDRTESAGERAAREAVAVEVCVGCPARSDCLDYAARVCPERGVWAGFPASELAVFAEFAAGLEPTWTLSGEVA